VIGWMVISQKRLNFRTKRNWKIQGKMGCNGLGNRCSTEKAPTETSRYQASGERKTHLCHRQ
jgi:hypothetical protein